MFKSWISLKRATQIEKKQHSKPKFQSNVYHCKNIKIFTIIFNIPIIFITYNKGIKKYMCVSLITLIFFIDSLICRNVGFGPKIKTGCQGGWCPWCRMVLWSWTTLSCRHNSLLSRIECGLTIEKDLTAPKARLNLVDCLPVVVNL